VAVGDVVGCWVGLFTGDSVGAVTGEDEVGVSMTGDAVGVAVGIGVTGDAVGAAMTGDAVGFISPPDLQVTAELTLEQDNARTGLFASFGAPYRTGIVHPR
jgi:hypothetical protein